MTKYITDKIGKTPLLSLKKEGMAEILVKLESFNPGGSVKDRPALYMIKDGEERGLLKAGGTIKEPTSGNMGIAIAMIGAAKGYKVILVMPETMSIERVRLMKSYGAQVILTEGKLGMSGSVDLARKLSEENGYFMLDQFNNQSNVRAHYETTGLEIIEVVNGPIDGFVAGVGTGGTITGIGRRLREVNPDLIIVGVEPNKSPVLSGGSPGSHGIQGIGANFIPSILDKSIINKVVGMDEEVAYVEARKLAKDHGILAGMSSGANMAAAIGLARELGEGKRLVTVLPDTGERYLSTDLFNRE